MPTVQRIQPIVFLGRCRTIRAPMVPKKPKAMPMQMIWASCNRFLPSRIPITDAERIKDTQILQIAQATRRAVRGVAISPANPYVECIYLLLVSRWVKLLHSLLTHITILLYNRLKNVTGRVIGVSISNLAF